jgi:hypothetical protein
MAATRDTSYRVAHALSWCYRVPRQTTICSQIQLVSLANLADQFTALRVDSSSTDHSRLRAVVCAHTRARASSSTRAEMLEKYRDDHPPSF